MATQDPNAVTRRLKYAILADNHHHFKKLCEKRGILPMYLFLKNAYKAQSQQKPEMILKECRKLNRMLLQYQTENKQYQTLETLSKSSTANNIIINDNHLIRHFMNALNQYQYVHHSQESTLSHLKNILQQLISDVSLSTYQHLTHGRFADHFNRMLGQSEPSATTQFKRKLKDEADVLALQAVKHTQKTR